MSSSTHPTSIRMTSILSILAPRLSLPNAGTPGRANLRYIPSAFSRQAKVAFVRGSSPGPRTAHLLAISVLPPVTDDIAGIHRGKGAEHPLPAFRPFPLVWQYRHLRPSFLPPVLRYPQWQSPSHRQFSLRLNPSPLQRHQFFLPSHLRLSVSNPKSYPPVIKPQTSSIPHRPRSSVPR